MKKSFVLVVVVAILAALVVAVPAQAQWHPSPAAPYGPGGYGGYGFQTGQVHEWLDLVERGAAMVPKAVANVVLTEKIWESRAPRPPVTPAVYYPPPPPAAPLTGRLVVITVPGELFLNGESQGMVQNREVKAFNLPAGSHSLILRTDKKVLAKAAIVQPSTPVVVNFDP